MQSESPPRTWTAEQVRALMRANEGFDRVPSVAAIDQLLAAGRITSAPRGAQITSRSDEEASFLIVLKGRVRMNSHTAGGREFLVAFLGPGQLYGMRPCIDRQARSYGSSAESDVELLIVRAHRLRELLASNPELNMIALQFLSHRLGVVSQAVEQFALWSPGQQLAWRLLSFLRAPDPASVNGMRLNVSQDSLAGMIGRTRQTTNKLLKSLESRGIIALDYGQVTILDIDALRTYLDTESD